MTRDTDAMQRSDRSPEPRQPTGSGNWPLTKLVLVVAVVLVLLTALLGLAGWASVQ